VGQSQYGGGGVLVYNLGGTQVFFEFLLRYSWGLGFVTIRKILVVWCSLFYSATPGVEVICVIFFYGFFSVQALPRNQRGIKSSTTKGGFFLKGFFKTTRYGEVVLVICY